MHRWTSAAAALAVTVMGPGGPAQAAPAVITLGTGAGPVARVDRAQPATLLRWDKSLILIDAGEGTPGQLVRAGVAFGDVDTIVLTHLHADHTGALFGFMAMRYQLLLPPLAIYGPPGTARLVAGLVEALGPLAELSLTPGRPRDPAASVVVKEIGDGDALSIKGVPLRVVANSHYRMDGVAPDPARAQSLSLRFDFPGRSVVLTGDTGPSEAVTRLASGADLLVSELIDPAAAMAEVRGLYPQMPAPVQERIVAHFVQQHLTTAEAGKLARDAGVRQLVITHAALAHGHEQSARAAITLVYKGTVNMARDLQQF